MKKADGELVRRSAGESSRTRLSLVTILVKKIGQGAPENSSSKENRQIRIFCYKYMIMVFFSSKVYPKLHNQHFNLTPVVTGGGGEIHTPYFFLSAA